LTLALTVDDRPPITYSMTLNRYAYLQADVQKLLTTLAGLSGTYKSTDVQACPARIGDVWTPVAGIAAYRVEDSLERDNKLGDAETNGNVIQVSNTGVLDSVVDYTHQYYMNSRTPWIGTSQVDAKLASDGTLTEGSAQVDDETWSTILSTVSSLVGDFTGAGAATPAAASTSGTIPTVAPQIEGIPPSPPRPSCQDSPSWPAPKQKVTYKVMLTTLIYKHDHTEQSFDLAKGCGPAKGGVLDGNFVVSKVDDKDSDSSKKDANAIEISGEIKLPKESKTNSDKTKGKDQ
jgi:hypothetical protein